MPTNQIKLAYLLIPLFAILGPFLQALDGLHIAFWRGEVLIIAGVLLAVSLLLAGALLTVGERLRILILASITLALIDVIFSSGVLKDLIIESAWSTSKQLRKATFIVLLFACLGVTYLLLWGVRQHAATILVAVMGMFFLATMVLHPAYLPGRFDKTAHAAVQRTAPGDLPIVVHLVFDELMAPGAMALHQPAGAEVAKAIVSLNEQFGFRLYGRVYSRHYFTVDSLGSMVNYDMSGVDTVWQDPAGAKPNAYFDEMKRRGYEIRVFQSSHLDFCAHPGVSVCNEMNSFDPLSTYVPEGSRKLRNVAGAILSAYPDSYTYRKLAGWLRKISGDWPSRYDVQAFPRWFHKISTDILSAPRSTLIFVHVLVPHAPHMLNENCELEENETNPYDLGERGGFGAHSEAARAHSYDRYFKQVVCVHRQLAGLLERLNKSERHKDAIIVVHGDHGSRISMSHHVETMSHQDFLDNYPAYFSIRGPGIEPGYDQRSVSLQRLFAEYFGSQTARAQNPSEAARVVVKSNSSKQAVEVDMPAFGAVQ